MLVTKIFALAFATLAAAVAHPSMGQLAANLGITEFDIEKLLSTTDISSLDITKYTKALKVDPKDVAGWTESLKTTALEQLQGHIQKYADGVGSKVTKRQQSDREANRAKVQAQVDQIIAQHRANHEGDHRRKLAGCPTTRCSICGAGLTVAYLASLTTCGTAVITETAISSGVLAAVALTQLTSCIGLASGVYTAGWAYCLGMTLKLDAENAPHIED